MIALIEIFMGLNPSSKIDFVFLFIRSMIAIPKISYNVNSTRVSKIFSSISNKNFNGGPLFLSFFRSSFESPFIHVFVKPLFDYHASLKFVLVCLIVFSFPQQGLHNFHRWPLHGPILSSTKLFYPIIICILGSAS